MHDSHPPHVRRFRPVRPGSRGAGRRAATRALGIAVGLGLIVSACGGSTPKQGRIEGSGPVVTAAPIVPDTAAEKPVGIPDPETYGLPPLATLQANPAGVAKVLGDRATQTTWTMKWKVSSGGTSIGTLVLEHLPPGGVDVDVARQAQAAGQAPPSTTAESGKLHVAGSLRAGDREFQLDILDTGSGPRVCLADDKGSWACNNSQLNLALQFLSLDGLTNLNSLLRQLLALPGLSVQYLNVGGAPSACFFFPPAPSLAGQGNSAGIDLSNGGSYCLSREGALTRLQVGPLDIRTIEYRKGADPAKFTQPV